ncbi:ABC transporter permease [Kutzneria viridogrisea]|uniref:Oligopeptide transport system permease protein OppC n=2 Tax=Kutzneria TaxID=43356 RepID=W5W0W9_9PSEU|nr:ABC transporter permease [Kutzneria albida]AHH94487.1 putative peptide transport permease protein [Kutzneria albida DSM 43870]MBA8930154.1 peptide/nickel transport system permease protein [Kutzneria viridogrisea]
MTVLDNKADQAVAEAPARRPVKRSRLTLRRFLRNRWSVAGLAVLVLLYVLAFSYPLFSPFSYEFHDTNLTYDPPTVTHWFGTDNIGTDMFVATMRGMQKSLTIGLLVGVISTLLSAVVGAAAGFFGGFTDRALMWLVDLLLVLPSFLIISISSPLFKGASWLIFVVLLVLFQWMITARIVRGMTLTLKTREYVSAARFMGQSSWRIIFKHILPNMASLLIVDATINVGSAVLQETGLSYFGFGVQPPDISLGTLIQTGSNSVLTFPWLFYAPAIMLILISLSVAVVGDGLRDALDPSSTKARRRVKRKKEAAA